MNQNQCLKCGKWVEKVVLVWEFKEDGKVITVCTSCYQDMTNTHVEPTPDDNDIWAERE